MTTPQSSTLRRVFSRNMLICIFAGFTSGLPLYFLINLIPAWLHGGHIDLKTIGLTTSIDLPFTWEFIQSPVMDAIRLPFLSHRRGRMLVTQISLLLALIAYASLNLHQHLSVIIGLPAIVAFFPVSRDIVLNAFRRKILSDEELGLGNSIHINAYRIATLIPGSLSLILTDRMPQGSISIITAPFMLPSLLMTLFLAEEPDPPPAASRTLIQTVVEPFQEFFPCEDTKQVALVLLFIFLYELGDSMVTSPATPFYLDMDFNKTDIDLIAKNASFQPAVTADILSGIRMLKLDINRILRLFGVVQVVTILRFAQLTGFGRFDTITLTEQMILAGVISAEAIGVGLGTAAFISYMVCETNPAFTVIQLALFTSLSAILHAFINATISYLTEWLGYVHFFWLCFILALPGTLLLPKITLWGGDKPTDQTQAKSRGLLPV